MYRLLPLLLVACAPHREPAPQTGTSSRPAVVADPPSGLTVLHVLSPAEGTAVRGALTEIGGRLYGLAGEAGPNGSTGCSSSANWRTVEHTAHCPGALFSLALDGSDFRVEHAFTRLDDTTRKNADGYHPYGTLSVGPDRRLYGVAQTGGSPPMVDDSVVPGFGALFAYDPTSGALQVLHSFASVPRALDGEYPMGAVAVDAAGRVYGTTKDGGAGLGTVWRWSPDGSFAYASLPGICYGGVTLAGGLLHGTTWTGGAGMGAYFTVDPDSMHVTVVDSFPAFEMNAHGNDNTPIQEPTVLRNGALIVAREFGGRSGTGLLAVLDPRAGIRVLREAADIPLVARPRFANATGGMLNGRVAEGRDGMIYGVAQYGGAHGTGGIYRMARDGSRFQLLYSFTDAAYPYGGVTVGSDGALYGTTFDTGQIWRFVPAASSPGRRSTR